MSISNAGLRDKVNYFTDVVALRRYFMMVVDCLQREPPDAQLLGPAAALVVLAEAVGIDPHEVVSIVQRAEKDIDGPFATQWQAMREYARGEFK